MRFQCQIKYFHFLPDPLLKPGNNMPVLASQQNPDSLKQVDYQLRCLSKR